MTAHKPNLNDSLLQALEQLGLDAERVVETLDGSELDDTAQGAMSTRTLGVVAATWLLGSPALAQTSLALVEVPEAPATVQVQSLDTPLEVRGLDASMFERHDAYSVTLRLETLNANHTFALLTGEGGIALVSGLLEEDPTQVSGLRIGAPDAEPVHTAASPEIDVLEALAKGDSWHEEIAMMAQDLNDVYTSAMLAGTLYRHRQVDDPVALVQQWMSGDPDTNVQSIRAWSRELSEDATTALVQAVLNELDQIEEGLRFALESLTFDDELWRRALVGLAERRDALSDVLFILSMRDGSKGFGDSIAELDALGERVVLASPLLEEARSSERLRRAAEFSPECWWTRLGQLTL